MKPKFYNSISKKKYKDYIKSPQWKRKRAIAIRLSGGKCKFCNSNKNLQVHHNNYVTLGRENIERDLIVLCENCHTTEHKIRNPNLFIKIKKCKKCKSDLMQYSFEYHYFKDKKVMTRIYIKCQKCDFNTIQDLYILRGKKLKEFKQALINKDKKYLKENDYNKG